MPPNASKNFSLIRPIILNELWEAHYFALWIEARFRNSSDALHCARRNNNQSSNLNNDNAFRLVARIKVKKTSHPNAGDSRCRFSTDGRRVDEHDKAPSCCQSLLWEEAQTKSPRATPVRSLQYEAWKERPAMAVCQRSRMCFTPAPTTAVCGKPMTIAALGSRAERDYFSIPMK